MLIYIPSRQRPPALHLAALCGFPRDPAATPKTIAADRNREKVFMMSEEAPAKLSLPATPAQEDANTDRFAEKLQQDVRSWTARDNDATDRAADTTLVLAAKAAKAATTRKRAKPAAKAPVVEESTKGRPFSMSYEGVSNAQYLAGRIARGAR